MKISLRVFDLLSGYEIMTDGLMGRWTDRPKDKVNTIWPPSGGALIRNGKVIIIRTERGVKQMTEKSQLC